MLSETATALFLRDGFDNVSIADVAAAAEVAKATVFNYFPNKEDLVLYQIRDHADEPAEVVRSLSPDESPIGALRRSFLAGLAARDAKTGLADDDKLIAFYTMVMSTPSLKLRLLELWMRSESTLTDALADVLGEPADAILAGALASQIIAVQRTLVVRNLQRVIEGERTAELYPVCVAEAEQVFSLLERCLPGVAALPENVAG